MIFSHVVNQWDLQSTKNFGLFDKAKIHFDDEWEQEDQRRKESFAEFEQFQQDISEKAKIKIRHGIPHGERRKWWLVATKGYKLLTEVGDVWPAAQRNSAKFPKSPISMFGGVVNILSYMPPEVADVVEDFLHVLWTRNRQIEFSPLIPTVATILLLYMEPQLAYLSIQAMINRSIKDQWYFTLTSNKFFGSVQGFRELVHSKCKSIVVHAESLKLDIAQIGLALFPVFFMPFTPLPVALTIFDSFAYEGRKILVRFCLALFIQEQRNLLKTTTAKDFIEVLINGMSQLNEISTMKSFINNSFGIFLSRGRHIEKMEDHVMNSRLGLCGSPLTSSASNIHDILSSDPQMEALIVTNRKLRRNSDSSADDFDINKHDPEVTRKLLMKASPEEAAESQLRMQREIARSALPRATGGNLLKEPLFYMLRAAMPAHIQCYQAKRVFALSEDGASFTALFQRTQRRAPYILLIQTSKRTVGFFSPEAPNPSMATKGRYYGRPSTFVFNADTQEVFRHEVPPNQLFLSVARTALMVGGPRPALFIEDGFHLLLSEHCDTFGSPPLTAAEGDPIIDVEAYMMCM